MSRILIFIAYSNWLIAAAAALLTSTTYIRYGYAPHWEIVLFVFLSTLLLYSFQRILKFLYIPQHPEHYAWCKKHFRFLVIQSVVAMLCLVPLVARLPVIAIYVLLTTGVFSLLYFFVSPTNLKATGLRHLPFLKSFLIAIVWGMVSCLVPLLSIGLASVSQAEITITYLEHVLFIYVLMIPFDIRDMNLDQREMKTLPQVLGERKARMIGLLLLPAFLLSLEWTPWARPLPVVITFFLASVVVFRGTHERKSMYFPYAVDGMLYLYGGLWWLFFALEII